MIQTYQGHFGEDGRFVPEGIVMKIPVGRRAIVNILDDEIVKPNTAHQKKSDDINKILADALQVENSSLTDADWDAMTTLRSQANAGLARKIDL